MLSPLECLAAAADLVHDATTPSAETAGCSVDSDSSGFDPLCVMCKEH